MFWRSWSHTADARKSWSVLSIHFIGPKKWTGKALSALPSYMHQPFTKARTLTRPGPRCVLGEEPPSRVINPTSLERRCGLTSNPLHKKNTAGLLCHSPIRHSDNITSFREHSYSDWFRSLCRDSGGWPHHHSLSVRCGLHPAERPLHAQPDCPSPRPASSPNAPSCAWPRRSGSGPRASCEHRAARFRSSQPCSASAALQP